MIRRSFIARMFAALAAVVLPWKVDSSTRVEMKKCFCGKRELMGGFRTTKFTRTDDRRYPYRREVHSISGCHTTEGPHQFMERWTTG